MSLTMASLAKYGFVVLKLILALKEGKADKAIDQVISLHKEGTNDYQSYRAPAALEALRDEILTHVKSIVSENPESEDLDVAFANATAALDDRFSDQNAPATFAEIAEYIDRPRQLAERWALSELDFERRILTETLRRAIEALPDLPGFMNWLAAAFCRSANAQRDLQAAVDRLLTEEARRDLAYEKRYRAAVLKRLNKVELFIDHDGVPEDAQEQRLSVAYVTLALGAGRGDSDLAIAADLVLDTSEDNPHLLIVGKAGSGKTTLMKWIAVHSAGLSGMHDPAAVTEAGAGCPWRTRIPFFIRVREWPEGSMPGPADFHRYPYSAEEPPEGWTVRTLRAGRGIVIFDGLDEVSPERRREFIEHIRSLVETYNDHDVKTWFLVTSRPKAIEPGALANPGFREYEVQDLSLDGRELCVNKWHEAVAERLNGEEERLTELETRRNRLLEHIAATPSAARLMNIPLLCALMCALNRIRRLGLPRTETELCESAVMMLLWQREEFYKIRKQDVPPAYGALSKEMRRLVVQHLAYRILTTEETLISRTFAVNEIATALGGPTGNRTEAEGVLKGLIERAGLLRDTGEDQVEFVHNTLRDYLASAEFGRRGEAKDLIKYIRKGELQRWAPVAVFAAGTSNLALYDFAQEILRGLLEPTWRQRLLPGTKRDSERDALALLAAGHAQFRLPPDMEKSVIQLREQFLPVREGKIARTLAAAGESALPYFAFEEGLSQEESLVRIEGLGAIGTDASLHEMRRYLQKEARSEVLLALGRYLPESDFTGLNARYARNRYAALLDLLTKAKVAHLITNLTSITVLDLSRTQLANLSPLADITSLTELNLSGNQVIDLSPLANLTTLTTLNLSGNQVIDLSPLASLTALCSLNLWRNKVSDVSPLANLSSLSELNLAENPVTNFFSLKSLYSLTSLNLAGTVATDLTPLSNLSSLKSLYLWQTGVTDLTPLSNLPLLETLNLWNSQVTDVTPLASIRSLTTLDLKKTRISNLAPVAKLTALTSLDISESDVIDLSYLRDLASLKILNLADTKVVDVSPLSNLASLKTLDLQGTEVTNLAPLATLQSLSKLNIARTWVNDIAPLSPLSSLEELSLADSNVADLAPLARLNSLVVLDLSGTKVVNLAPMVTVTSAASPNHEASKVPDTAPEVNLKSLKKLDLSRTRLSDTTSLAKLFSLTILNLNETQITDLGPLSNLTLLTSLHLQSTYITDLTPLAGLPSLHTLNISKTNVSSVAPLSKLFSLTKLDISETRITDMSPLNDHFSLKIQGVRSSGRFNWLG